MEILNRLSDITGLSENSPMVYIEQQFIDLIIQECEEEPAVDKSNSDYWAWEPLIGIYITQYNFGNSEEPMTIRTLPPQKDEQINSEIQIEVEPKEWKILGHDDLYDLLVAVYKEGHIIINEE